MKIVLILVVLCAGIVLSAPNVGYGDGDMKLTTTTTTTTTPNSPVRDEELSSTQSPNNVSKGDEPAGSDSKSTKPEPYSDGSESVEGKRTKRNFLIQVGAPGWFGFGGPGPFFTDFGPIPLSSGVINSPLRFWL